MSHPKNLTPSFTKDFTSHFFLHNQHLTAKTSANTKWPSSPSSANKRRTDTRQPGLDLSQRDRLRQRW